MLLKVLCFLDVLSTTVFSHSALVIVAIIFLTINTAVPLLDFVKRVPIQSYSGPHFFRIFPHSD